MIIKVVEHKEFIRALRNVYGDSWRYTLRVFKWMIKEGCPYMDARSVMMNYDLRNNPRDVGKNLIARQVVSDKGLEKCEFLVDRCVSEKSMKFKEDLGLKMYKTLVKRGYGFYRDTFFYSEDDSLTCVAPNDRDYVERMMGVYFRPKEPGNPQNILKMMLTLDCGFDLELISDYMAVGPIDKSLAVRLANLINDSKRYMFRVNQGRDYEKIFFYESDFQCVLVNEMPMNRISEVIRNFQGFSGKYEKLCSFFLVDSFKTGNLMGSGKFSLFGSNDFYCKLFLHGVKLQRAMVEYVLVCDSELLELDPFGFFFSLQESLIGPLEIWISPIIDVFLRFVNNDGFDNEIRIFDGAGDIVRYKIRGEERIGVIRITDFVLCPLCIKGGPYKVVVGFNSNLPIQINVCFEARKWRGGKYGSLINESELR